MPTFISVGPMSLGERRDSTGVVADGYVFAAGTAADPLTGQRRADADSVHAEVAICLGIIKDVLTQANCTPGDIVKVACWLSAQEHLPSFFEAYRQHCPQGPDPVDVTVVAGLPRQCRMAIEVIASIPTAAEGD